MTSLYMACEDVCQEADAFILETTALNIKPSQAIDRAMTYLGLESSTVLHNQISTEGLFSWLKEKLSKLGRKISVAVNKIYAKLTRADEATKEIIAKASKDDTVELPISGKKIAVVATIATLVATIVALSCAAIIGGKKEDGQKADSLFKQMKDAVASVKSEKNEKGEKVKSSKVKQVFTSVRKAIGVIGKNIKEFFARFKKTSADAESLAKKNDGSDNKKGVFARFKGIGKSIKRMFSSVAEFFKNCIRKFKNKTTDARDKAEAKAEEKKGEWSIEDHGSFFFLKRG